MQKFCEQTVILTAVSQGDFWWDYAARVFPLSFRAPRNDLKTQKKNSPNSLTGLASHNSAQQPASIFLSRGALFPEVHTQIQVAAIVPEKMLFWEDKMLSLGITHSSPSPLTPPVPLPIPRKSGLINPPEVFQPFWPITNQLDN